MGKIERIVQISRDPRWWSFYIQRLIKNPARRKSIARRLSGLKPKYQVIDSSLADNGNADLNSSGLYRLDQVLSDQQTHELVAYFGQKKVKDPYRSSEPEFFPNSDRRPAEAHVAHHNALDIVKAPYLMELANSPKVLDVVSQFLGCKPTIGYMAAWWSYATDIGPQQAENFHRDVDDWRFVKPFVYLTDVTPDSGPHQYVLHSSAQPKLTEIRRFDDEEVAAAFGQDNIITMTSRAGEGFLEDTYGVHKGQPVQSGQRLLFQVVYTITPLPYAPKSPVASMPSEAPFDPWINRVYLK